MKTTDKVGLKELRANLQSYIKRVDSGETITVYDHSRPVFKMQPLQDERWEPVIDFTKITKDGVDIDELIARLES